MPQTWIVVANSTNARILEAANNNELKEVETLSHPEGRLRNTELVSDRPGRAFQSVGPTRHAEEPKSDPQKLEFDHFATTLAAHLKKAHHEGKYKKIYISASPAFLGLLRPKFSKEVSDAIAEELNLDLTQVSVADIRKHLPYVL